MFELTYRAAGGGHTPVDLDLSITSDGHATAYVGTSWSIPLERVSAVGVFDGDAPADLLAAIGELVGDGGLLSGADGGDGTLPGGPTRSLQITIDGRTVEASLGGQAAEPRVEELEVLLQRVALATTAHPTRAIQATLDLAVEEGRVAGAIELRSVGSEAATIVLLGGDGEPDVAARAGVTFQQRMALPSGASMPMNLATVELSPDALQALGLPAGPITCPPDATYRLPFDAVEVPAATHPVVAFGQVDLWLDARAGRRSVRILTADTPLG